MTLGKLIGQGPLLTFASVITDTQVVAEFFYL